MLDHTTVSQHMQTHTYTHSTTAIRQGSHRAIVSSNNYVKFYCDPEAAICAQKRNLCSGKEKCEWRDLKWLPVFQIGIRHATRKRDDMLYKYQKKKYDTAKEYASVV